MILNGRTYYHPVLDIPKGRRGTFAVKHRIVPAGEPLRLGTMRTVFFGQPSAATPVRYPHPTRWHVLTEDGSVWMQDIPIEQRQHDELLNGMRGRVLVGGLGLGYAVTALALKRSVTDIVVVERSAEVIDLVWPHLRREVHEKACIIHEDLFAYLHTPFLHHANARKPLPGFSWAFYDIWAGDGEATFHETVAPLLKLSNGLVRRVRCWNEDIMRAQLANGLLIRLHLLAHRGAMVRDVLSVERLAQSTGSVYTDWAVPFWRWVQAHAEADHALAAQAYALNYARGALDRDPWYLKQFADADAVVQLPEEEDACDTSDSPAPVPA